MTKSCDLYGSNGDIDFGSNLKRTKKRYNDLGVSDLYTTDSSKSSHHFTKSSSTDKSSYPSDFGKKILKMTLNFTSPAGETVNFYSEKKRVFFTSLKIKKPFFR